MANRNFPSGGKIYSFQVMPVMIQLDINIGASGAVSSISGSGVASVTKSSTGTYLITLQDPYNSLMCVLGNMQVASGVSGVDSIEQIGSFVSSVSGATLSIQTLLNNAVANPASGSTINLMIMLNNSSIQ